MSAAPAPDDGERLRRRIDELSADVERLRVSESRLRDSEEELRILFENAPDAIFILDMRGAFVDGNRAAEQLIGYSRQELIGRSFLKLGATLVPLSQMPKATKLLALNAMGMATGPEELVLNQKGGGQVRVEIRGYPIALGGRRVVLGIARDVTRRHDAEKERRRLERRLNESRHQEAIGTLAAGIAHTFNNLLTPIRGYAELLKLRADDPARVARHADAIVTAADEAAALVQKLLDYTRRASSSEATVELNATIEAVLERLAPRVARDVRVVRELEAAPDEVLGHEDELERALGEIVENAIEAMTDGAGTLTVGTRIAQVDDAPLDGESSRRAFEIAPPGRWLVVEVGDTGPGLSDEVRRRMFEPFFSTKDVAEGAGMGLSMAQGIVATHRGHITVDSSAEGTTIRVYLPPAK